MTTLLITGAGGFMGAHVTQHVLETTDWDVVALDSFRHRGKTSRLRQVFDKLGRDRVKVITHDLRAPIDEQTDAEIGDVDMALSIASRSHVDTSIIYPRAFIEDNVAVVLTVMEWLRWRAVEWSTLIPTIHISTDEVYGPAYGDHRHREGEPHRPSNPYSASKSAQEQIVYSYWRTYGLPLVISNTMNLFGEMQDPEKFIPMTIGKIMRGEKVQVHADMATMTPGSRMWLHARNQADALVYLLKYGKAHLYDSSRADIDRWNIVGDVEVNNLRMAEMISDCLETPIHYELVDFHSSRPGHDLRYALDGMSLREAGWVPPVGFFESLANTVEWTLAHPEWLIPSKDE